MTGVQTCALPISREVRIGTRLSDAYEVLSGLEEGESILASGNFFIDSESRIQAAQAASAAPIGRARSAP